MIVFEQFPGCCGIAVLRNFDLDDYYIEGKDYEVAKKEFIKRMSDSITNNLRTIKEYGYCRVVASTNDEQTIAAYVLKKKGFKKSFRFNNVINTGSDIIFWVKIIRQR